MNVKRRGAMSWTGEDAQAGGGQSHRTIVVVSVKMVCETRERAYIMNKGHWLDRRGDRVSSNDPSEMA